MSADDIVLHESYDRYASVGSAPGLGAKWIVNDGGANFSQALVAGRLGGQALRTSHLTSGSLFQQGYSQRPFVSAQQSFCAHFAHKHVTAPDGDGSHPIYSFMSDTTHQIGVQITTLGEVVVTRQSGDHAGTELGRTPINTVIFGAWHFFKLYLFISNTVGVVKLYVDNTLLIDLSGQDTQNHATTSTCNIMRIGNATNPGINAQAWDTDDLYISAGTIYPEGTLVQLNPTSDVAAGFTRSTGSTNFGTVDEDPASTADYNESNVVGTLDTFGMEDLASTPKTIMAVILTAVAAKTDAGDRALGLRCISGATTSEGPDNWLGSSQLHYDRVMLVDPNTAAAWSAAAVNALQAGYKVNA